MVAPLRLADLLASVSLVSDLAFALPADESMRSTIIATGIARRMGLDETIVADVFYATLLQHLGCAGFAHETAVVYDDELTFNAAAARTDTNDIRDIVSTMVRATARGRGPIDWTRVVAYTFARGGQFGRRYATARCEVGRETARRLRLPDGVRRGLYEVAESWNGHSGVQGLAGDDISIVARIAAAAAVASRFDAIGGTAAAVEALRRRAGGELDPAVVAACRERADEIIDPSRDGDPRDTLMRLEPMPNRSVTPADLPDVAAAIGDIADLKSTFTLGHSQAVADLATGAAEAMGLDDGTRAHLRLAAHLHDIGRVGISTSVWDRPTSLTATEWEQVRLHAYHSERILARCEPLAEVARIAGLHHERLDGSGYHRGTRSRDIPMTARILAVADAFAAMTQARPHRAALRREEAVAALHAEVAAGRIDADATNAVMESAGLERTARHRGRSPAALSAREIEVLRLIARGLSNREIAAQLVVSPRTAEHHVQHIYTKIGASSRAAAALFAMEHDLLA